MYIFFSCASLFSVVFLLVFFYHLFFWNSSDCVGLRSWVSSFECGFFSACSSECYFSYTYFVLLVFFVVFDLEVSLLLNVPFVFSFFSNSVYYLLFMFVLAFGYWFELYGGYARWAY